MFPAESGCFTLGAMTGEEMDIARGAEAGGQGSSLTQVL